jgi:hypothetical protein
MTLPDPVDTIERFAEISALLDDPFAEEDEVLRALGLDADGWDEIEARWLLRLRAEDAAPLGKRFGKAYRETVERLKGVAPSTEEIADTEPEGPGFLTPDAQPWRAEAAAVGRAAVGAAPPLLAAPEPASPRTVRAAPPVVDVAATFTGAAPTGPALPFQTPSNVPPDATMPLGAVLPRPSDFSVEDTLENAGALPGPVTPFQPPRQTEDDGPGDTLPLGALLPKPALPFTPR